MSSWSSGNYMPSTSARFMKIKERAEVAIIPSIQKVERTEVAIILSIP
jgi:hypothetical protein